jgi:hypothetical protein
MWGREGPGQALRFELRFLRQLFWCSAAIWIGSSSCLPRSIFWRQAGAACIGRTLRTAELQGPLDDDLYHHRCAATGCSSPQSKISGA